MKINPKIDEDYNKLINTQIDNYEIIKLYSQFVDGILCDEEKSEKCKKNSKVVFYNKIEIHEKDYTNFDIEILNENINLPYLIISASKDHIGKIIDLSMNIIKIFGYSKNELIGKNINILIPKIFHKIHDLLLINQIESDNLKLFDELNKKKVYFPHFIKKEVYGLSKMKFLIELNINIYFVKTEKNIIVYIVEIENYNPIKVDLIKNKINYSKYCVLTDENFLIQTFTANSLNLLKLTYNEINSNFCIINYIKQFQDDYLTAINNSSNSKYSHINKSELDLEEKSSEQKNILLKKKIKNDLLTKKYSKKCKITWSKDNDFDFSKSNVFNRNKIKGDKNNKEIQLDLFMEIQKITLKNKLIGYYFYFSKFKNKTYNNMSYQLEKDETIDTNNYLTELKKYQCKFTTIMDTKDIRLNKLESQNENNNNNLIGSFILDTSKLRDEENKEINFYRKKERKKSLDKNSKVTFKLVDSNNPINHCSYTNKYFPEEDELTITGEYVPSYSSHFMIDLGNMSFIQVTKNGDPLKYLEILKKEANDKINIYKEKLQLTSQDSENSNESEEDESDDDSDSNSENSSDGNSLYENIRKQSSMSNTTDQKSINKTPSKIHKKNTKNDFQNKNENNNDTSMNKGVNKKLQNKNNIINNFYKVKLNNIHYMIYDFYKDMIVEGNKNEIVSKVEAIMTDTKNMESINFEKDERFSFIKSFRNKNKKNTKEIKDIKNIENVRNNQTNNINEEKLFKKKIHEALNKHKDEVPIIKLKIFIFISYFVFVLLAILILLFSFSNISKTNKYLNLIKCIICIRHCSQISVYYLREMTLLNFVVDEIKGGKYTNFVANYDFKEVYKTLIKEQILELFIENQSFMKTIYSSSLSFSKNSNKILSEIKIKVKMSNNPKLEVEYDIITFLVQYNSAFYNLASSTTDINQNHTDLSNYIYNNLNEYKRGFLLLMKIFQNEIKESLNNIIRLVIILGLIVLIFFFLMYILVIKNFFSSIKKRGNYMKVFYGINENILKNLIESCENLMNKLKSSEEQRYNEEETLNESNEEKINLDENKKKQNLSQNNNLNYDIENIDNIKASKIGIIFIIIYTIFSLISYYYYIYNCSFLINKIRNAISVSDFCSIESNCHIQIIEFFNVYREFIFDNQTIIDNMPISNFIEQLEEYIGKTIKILNVDNDKFLSNNELHENKTLCSYYINDFFDSSSECEEKIGLITTYDFKTFAFNFIEEIKLSRDIVKYKLENETILGNLTQYNYLDYINNELIPRNSYGEETDNTIIFRLDLFNNETLHFNLNIMFFSVILPYIQENRQKIYDILTIGKASSIVTLYFIVFIISFTLIYLFYFLPVINYINKIIYKTKNMLSIIPLNILSSQSGVSKLLNISNEK